MAKINAVTMFKNSQGKRVPSVSTVVGLLDKPGLVGWAHKLGLAGVVDLRAHRDAAKQAGKITHALVESCLAARGRVYFGDIDTDKAYADTDLSGYTEEEIALSRPAFGRAARLLAGIGPMTTGLIEYSMISEKHQFGGRLDWYGVAGESGPLTLMDIKSGKDVYADSVIQAAAYRGLLLELGNKVERVIIARIGGTPEEGEEIRELSYGELDAAWEAFLHLRAIHGLKKTFAQERKAA
jgi:hypothetical protein